MISPTAFLDSCIDVQNRSSPITLEEMGVPAAEITDGAVDTADNIASNQVVDAYNAGTAGNTAVEFAAIATTNVPDDYEILIIDVTDGREAFPRRTFTAPTLAELKDAINNATLEAGDGKVYTATLSGTDNTIITVTYPLGVIAKVAASDGAVMTVTAAALPQGYTTAQAAEYLNNALAPQYGRTNRIKFPVIEPAVMTPLTAADTAAGGADTWNLNVFTKVSEVRFDKNTGSSYQDVETFEIFVPAASNNQFADVTPAE